MDLNPNLGGEIPDFIGDKTTLGKSDDWQISVNVSECLRLNSSFNITLFLYRESWFVVKWLHWRAATFHGPVGCHE